MPLTTGEVLNNRYRIVRLLGQGGFGAVYRAWDANLERPVALKENLETTSEAQRQFKREAQILYDLSHPGLPKVIDHFSIPGQGQYLAMEFVEGEDLAQMLEHQGGPLPEAQLLPWIMQVCQALSYMHAQNPPVIHRDIKPANIKITPSSKAMLVDFGIAKVYDPSLRTIAGARAVTSGYSPPEQYGRGLTDAQSDVYALAATVYHLLTGVEPPDSMDIVSGVSAPLRPAVQANPAVSPQASRALEHALQLNRANRTASVAEFQGELFAAPAAPAGKAGAVLVQTAPAQARTLPVQAAPPDQSAWPVAKSRRPPWLWIGGALALVVVFGLALWGLSELFGGPKVTPVSQTARAAITPELPALITDEQGVKMALVPAGEFQMGSEDGDENERPVHAVYLDAFYMDVYEVTNALYEKCVQAGVCTSPQHAESYTRVIYYGTTLYAEYPVISMDWEKSQRLCTWRGARLPTEAEWEKAARGGLEGKDYPWGDKAPVCQKGAQSGAKFNDNAGCDKTDTEPVGSYSPNGYGLYDMAGNVWELVTDWYGPYSASRQENPVGPASGEYRVLRGGAWYLGPNLLRVADRMGGQTSGIHYFTGFRCARSP